MAGTLYVVTMINSLGPAIDPAHADLLTTWEEVDQAMDKAFQTEYRNRYVDSDGRGVKLSFFCVSWSGFKSNPVYRPFGWHTVSDHLLGRYGAEMKRWDDGIYWLYNHPAASGVGNKWGTDWLQNTHYLNILNHFLVDRGWFPSVVQVPTEDNDTSNFLEQWFPFDFGNRNSAYNNLANVESDGKRTSDVFDWSIAPSDWSHYHPSERDFRIPGGMHRTVFRIVDIFSRMHQIRQEDIEGAFRRCKDGRDTVLSAFEHDFRDRYDVIASRFLDPIGRLRKRYPDVHIRYANALEAAASVTHNGPGRAPSLGVTLSEEGIRVRCDGDIFGVGPYACIFDRSSSAYAHAPLTRIGEHVWLLRSVTWPASALLAIGVNDKKGRTCVKRWIIGSGGTSIQKELGESYRFEQDVL